MSRACLLRRGGVLLASGSLAAALAAPASALTAPDADLAALRLLIGADLLSRAGQIPTTADDIDFAYPRAAFASSSSILSLAAELESLQLGAYVGASAGLQSPEVRIAVAQISANEAQHAGSLNALAGKPVIGKAFGPALDADAVSTALSAYES